MRKLVAVLLGCVTLAGCASSWEGEVRLKVTEVDPHYVEYQGAPERTRINTDLVGGMPEGAIDRRQFTGKYFSPKDIEGTVAVGDEIVCTARQKTSGALQTSGVKTELSGCKKA